ncbi:MAG TPA: hypothetical protein VNS63_12570 [Blastocatellia bacterium]|nr:hypothetical protein [Blastocatellia bacterium]
MTDLSIAIQHTPSRPDRRKWVQAMIQQLRSEDASVPIALIQDAQLEGCWPTYRRALEAAGDASHHLVLQDDLGLCRDFIQSVKEVIRARPTNLIALYSNAGSVFTARDRGESWVEKAGACGPSVIWPRELIAEFLQWQDIHIDRSFAFDTVRVSMWLIKTSKKAFTTVPSLTQHLGSESSTLGLNSPTKVATWYVGEDRSALGIDWSQGLLSPPQDTTPIRQEWWDHFRE